MIVISMMTTKTIYIVMVVVVVAVTAMVILVIMIIVVVVVVVRVVVVIAVVAAHVVRPAVVEQGRAPENANKMLVLFFVFLEKRFASTFSFQKGRRLNVRRPRETPAEEEDDALLRFIIGSSECRW